MDGILADINIQGQVDILRLILEGSYWGEVWQSLHASCYTFPDLGLPANASDWIVWETCQQRRLVLVTGNRNDDAPDSLEAAIRTRNTAECLPVITLADPEQVRHGSGYANRAIAKLLEYLLEIEKFYGTGRLYIP